MQKNEAIATKPETEQTEGGSFSLLIGKTTYTIGVHFSQTSKETLEDKVKRLIQNDVKAGNF